MRKTSLRNLFGGFIVLSALSQIGCGKSNDVAQAPAKESPVTPAVAAQPQANPTPNSADKSPVTEKMAEKEQVDTQPRPHVPLLDNANKGERNLPSGARSTKPTITERSGPLQKAMTSPRFHDATLPPNAVPNAAVKPMKGMDVDAVLMDVAKRWPTIVFEKDGKAIDYVAKMETSLGDIEFDLYPDKAPNHVRNFVILCQIGFYDGLIIHRVAPGHVIQGGCPYGNGEGDAGYWMKSEFNNLKHRRGVLSMPRDNDVNSGGCQFFICVADRPQLDHKYSGFGKVTKGMDVVDKISLVRRHANAKPMETITIKKATAWIKEPAAATAVTTPTTSTTTPSPKK